MTILNIRKFVKFEGIWDHEHNMAMGFIAFSWRGEKNPLFLPKMKFVVPQLLL